jgi:LysR family transcriptional regulator for metE and metH
MIIETRHLQLVAAIAKHGTLTRASQQLNLTQSALSHQLLTLEARLRAPLFHRLGKKMASTPAGARLLLAAERTLAELEQAEEDVRRTASGRTGLLRITTECYTTYHWMPRVLRAFALRRPGIEVQIVAEATADPIGAVHDGRVDLAVMMQRHGGKHLRALPLFDDEMLVVTAPDHPFAGKPFVELEDLATEHLLVYTPLTDASSYLGGLLRAASVSPRKSSRIQLTEAILELVEAGIGVSVMAQWAVGPSVARGRLAATRLTRQGVHRRWHAVALRQTALEPHVKDFLQLLAPGPRVLEPRLRPARIAVGTA